MSSLTRKKSPIKPQARQCGVYAGGGTAPPPGESVNAEAGVVVPMTTAAEASTDTIASRTGLLNFCDEIFFDCWLNEGITFSILEFGKCQLAKRFARGTVDCSRFGESRLNPTVLKNVGLVPEDCNTFAECLTSQVCIVCSPALHSPH